MSENTKGSHQTSGKLRKKRCALLSAPCKKTTTAFFEKTVSSIFLAAICLWGPFIPSAWSAPVDFVEVHSSDLNCIFDPECRLTVSDTVDDIALPGTTGSGFIQSRTFSGAASTPASGTTAYEFRIDLRNLVGILDIPCIRKLRVDTGELVSTLDYNGDGSPGEQVYVVTGGALGSIGISRVERIGDSLEFTFSSGICGGGSSRAGTSSYFFGFVSEQQPRFTEAIVITTSNTEHTFTVRTPEIPCPPDYPVSLTYCNEGIVSTFPVVVPPGTEGVVLDLAMYLAGMLAEITDQPVLVEEGDGRTGIAIGLHNDFPIEPYLSDAANNVESDQGYLLRNHDNGFFIASNTESGLENAVVGLLHKIGFRHYFPGETWKIIPSHPDLQLVVDIIEEPDFTTRSIFHGFGSWNVNAEAMTSWKRNNRITRGINSRHAWQQIITDHRAEFDLHPEWLGRNADGSPSTKLCVSEPELKALVTRWAMDKLSREPNPVFISLEPSDGADGWDGCAVEESAIGTPTDRVVTLANHVANAIFDVYPNVWVTMQAYSRHAAPPSAVISINPQVLVFITDTFISGFTLDELFDGWEAAGARTLGMRALFGNAGSIYDRDMPQRRIDIQGVEDVIRDLYSKEVRHFVVETNNAFGPRGLSQYFNAWVLWDTELDAFDVRQEFINLGFEEGVRESIRDFFDTIDGDREPLMSRHLIGQMYRHLASAYRDAGDSAVKERIEQLILYTRYTELYANFRWTGGQLEEFLDVVRFSYRYRRTHMSHSLAIYRSRELRQLHERAELPVPLYADFQRCECVFDESKICQYDNPAKVHDFQCDTNRNPLKTEEPFSALEIDTILANGIANNPVVTFVPLSFGSDLMPADSSGLTHGAEPSYPGVFRAKDEFYVWVASDLGASPEGSIFSFQLGLSRQKASIEFNSVEAGVLTLQDLRSEFVGCPEPLADRNFCDVNLNTTESGLHLVKLDVTGSQYYVNTGWADTYLVQNGTTTIHRYKGYFYVPPGTASVAGYAGGKRDGALSNSNAGSIRNQHNVSVHTFTGENEYFNIPVPVADRGNGMIWSFAENDREVSSRPPGTQYSHTSVGSRRLFTVPPYISYDSNRLLLPSELLPVSP